MMPEVPIARGPVESTINGAGEELAVVVTAGGFDKILAVGVAVFEPERGTVTRVAVGVSVFKPASQGHQACGDSARSFTKLGGWVFRVWTLRGRKISGEASGKRSSCVQNCEAL